MRIVLHDTESHDTAGIAEIRGVFNFWHTQKNPDWLLAKFWLEFVVDRDGNVGRGGDPTQIQWHVTNLNTGLIATEQIGFATFPNLLWRRKRRKQLYAVARIIAWAHGRYGIPIRVRRDPRLPGVTTHRRVGIAGIDPSGHTDPGRHIARIRHLPRQDDPADRLQTNRRRDARKALRGPRAAWRSAARDTPYTT